MSHKLLRRFEVLVSTGSPGLYRVLIFFIVERIFSLSELGKAASGMAGAQIASYATAVGWLTLALVRLPAVSTRREAVETFYQFASMSLLTTLLVSLFAAGAARMNLLPFGLSSFLWQLWGWTSYQMGRHYFVAFRSYRTIITLDALLIVLTIGALQAFHFLRWSPATAIGLALIAIASIMFALIGIPATLPNVKRFEGKGLEFGFTNLLSGGISLVIVPAAEKLCGASFAGLVSLLASITAIGMLLPRAVSLAQLPLLARLKGDRKEIGGIVGEMKRAILLSSFGTFAANLGFVFAIVIWKTTDEHQRLLGVVCGVFLCVQCSVGVLGTVNSNVMMVFERSRQSAVINIKTGLMFIFIAIGAIYCGGQTGFLILMSGVLLVLVVRNAFIKNDARHISKKYHHSIRISNNRNGDVFPVSP
jgi:hypothetical protein